MRKGLIYLFWIISDEENISAVFGSNIVSVISIVSYLNTISIFKRFVCIVVKTCTVIQVWFIINWIPSWVHNLHNNEDILARFFSNFPLYGMKLNYLENKDNNNNNV